MPARRWTAAGSSHGHGSGLRREGVQSHAGAPRVPLEHIPPSLKQGRCGRGSRMSHRTRLRRPGQLPPSANMAARRRQRPPRSGPMGAPASPVAGGDWSDVRPVASVIGRTRGRRGAGGAAAVPGARAVGAGAERPLRLTGSRGDIAPGRATGCPGGMRIPWNVRWRGMGRGRRVAEAWAGGSARCSRFVPPVPGSHDEDDRERGLGGDQVQRGPLG